MKKALKILYPFYLLIALLFLECGTITPIITDVCNVSTDICNVAAGACQNVPPGYEDICNIASDVCNYSSTICQLIGTSKLSDQEKQYVLEQLQSIKSDLILNSKRNFSKNVLDDWKNNRLRLNALYGYVKK